MGFIQIPDEIVEDRSLIPLEKLLYGDIASLSKNGGCWACNDYFAERYGVTDRHIKKMIKKLAAAGLITVTRSGKGKSKRSITTNTLSEWEL